MQKIYELFNVDNSNIMFLLIILLYTDIGLLPCKRDRGNRRIFDDESANWMQGICCLKGCGASIDDIKEYCRLCLLPESEDTLKARYNIILKQRNEAYKRLKEAQYTVSYMENKVKHYKDILSGILPDDTNPQNWTESTKPQKH